jgi:uncharacterized protein YqjF (DUF2071 family)
MRAGFDRSMLDAVDHRPWDMPQRPWLMKFVCHDVLFAHWRVDPGWLRALLPEGLTLDLYDGQAWVTLVPFRMADVSLRGIPPLPAISSFAQVNLRTYVQVDDDRPGTYHFSLDADSRIASGLASLMGLPFHAASIRMEHVGPACRYESRRVNPGIPAELQLTYVCRGPACHARLGSLDYFLTERYCMYGLHDRFGLFRIELHHRPWPLQHSDVRFDRNTLAETIGLRVDRDPVAVHFAARQDVIAWPPERVVAWSRSTEVEAQRYQISPSGN